MSSNDYLKKARTFVEKKKAQEELLKRQFGEIGVEISSKKEQVGDLIKARWLFSEAARLTQEKVKGYLEETITMCIRSLYTNRPFRFLADFNFKRNKSECLLRVQDGEKEPYVPKESMGGGVCDIISIGLRPTMWKLENPRSINTIFLDEPFKFVGKGEMLLKAGKLLREISRRFNIQFIINTHEPELSEIADRSWFIIHDGERSLVDRKGGGKEQEAEASPVRIRKRK